MDTLEELSAAFKKIIVGYKNIVCNEEYTIDNEPNSLADCIKNTLEKNPSRKSHLDMFLQVIKHLEALSEHMTFLEQVRDDLILLIQELYSLNHDGAYHTIKFNSVPYELSTTVSNYGYKTGLSYFGLSRSLTHLGECIRDYLLVPLDGTNVGEAVAKIKIGHKIKEIFSNFLATENAKIILAKEEELQQQVNSQNTLLALKDREIESLRNNQMPKQTERSVTSGLGVFDRHSDKANVEEDVSLSNSLK